MRSRSKMASGDWLLPWNDDGRPERRTCFHCAHSDEYRDARSGQATGETCSQPIHLVPRPQLRSTGFPTATSSSAWILVVALAVLLGDLLAIFRSSVASLEGPVASAISTSANV